MTDIDARKAASSWHGGGGTSMYRLASTGAIDSVSGLVHETMSNVTFHTSNEDMQELLSLRNYITDHGPRGPVDGWADLNW